MVKLTVKWGTQSYVVDVDASKGVETFRAQLLSLTGVPCDRQKLMCKAWKGILKDDVSLSSLPLLVDGSVVSLMGTADVAAKPAAATVFVEDVGTSHTAAVKAGMALPSGLVNEGNTCYANSTLEALRFVPELKEGLQASKVRFQQELVARALGGGGASGAARGGAGGGGGGDIGPSTLLCTRLADVFTRLDKTSEGFEPAE